MVAKITTPQRVSGALNYNEQKVKKGTAECIHVGNYLLEANQLSYHQKLAGFENFNSLNDRATTKTLHVSLNFDPSEKLTKETLIQIAETYMEKIGFGDQPYLVYHHHDAGHPHIHIVSTTIRSDGSRINTHNIGRNQSEKARKEIEYSFSLVKAGKEELKSIFMLPPVDIKRALYGKDETKRSISNIVTPVMNHYKYCSLPEFNAALKQFNVVADRGSEDSRVFKTGGLIYRLLDETGNKVGVPIKASLIPSRPTLARLNERFLRNKPAKEAHRIFLKSTIDTVITEQPSSIEIFKKMMEKEKIFVLLRLSADGKPFGITFVDNISKCVFNGSDLGKHYSIAAITNRIYRADSHFSKTDDITSEKHSLGQKSGQEETVKMPGRTEAENKEYYHSAGLSEKLIESRSFNERIPYQFKKKRKKRKKRSNDL